MCKQVERAVAHTLAAVCQSDALLGASVGSVEPAPDASRLMVIIVLGGNRDADDARAARTTLIESTPAFRREVAQSIHRKRVPELVFDVQLPHEVARG